MTNKQFHEFMDHQEKTIFGHIALARLQRDQRPDTTLCFEWIDQNASQYSKAYASKFIINNKTPKITKECRYDDEGNLIQFGEAMILEKMHEIDEKEVIEFFQNRLKIFVHCVHYYNQHYAVEFVG